MKCYMGYDETVGSREGAVLIFANNCKEARKIGFRFIQSWFDTEWIDMKAKWLKKDYEYLNIQADQEKLKNNIPHVIDSPKTCPVCEIWGGVIREDGCSFCD